MATVEHANFFWSLQTKMLALDWAKKRKQTRGKLTSSTFFQSFIIKSEFKHCQLPRILKHNLTKNLYSVFCALESILSFCFLYTCINFHFLDTRSKDTLSTIWKYYPLRRKHNRNDEIGCRHICIKSAFLSDYSVTAFCYLKDSYVQIKVMMYFMEKICPYIPFKFHLMYYLLSFNNVKTSLLYNYCITLIFATLWSWLFCIMLF